MIFVVSGPGGVGKGTIVNELIQQDQNLCLSRSWTTRPKRDSEPKDAYTFVSVEDFKASINRDGFLEWVEFLGNYYGTPIPSQDDLGGKDLLLEIELVGARAIKSKFPKSVLILVVPPSEEEQRKRLASRGESPQRIDERVQKGRREIETGKQFVDQIVVNDDLAAAVGAVLGIIQRYRKDGE